MEPTPENRKHDGYTYTIDLGKSEGPVVDRGFVLKNGETVTIHVKLDRETNRDLRALHVNSIERAIEILRSYLPKESADPSH